MAVTPGSLLQYKEQCYGRHYRNLPKVPFERTFSFLPTINSNVFNIPVEELKNPLNSRKYHRKKYVLFCSQVVWVHHPSVDTIGCNYIKCFISDPYTNDTTEGWIREDWVEPLNEFGTYYEQNLLAAKPLLQKLMENKNKIDKEALREEFRELLRVNVRRDS